MEPTISAYVSLLKELKLANMYLNYYQVILPPSLSHLHFISVQRCTSNLRTGRLTDAMGLKHEHSPHDQVLFREIN